MTLQFGFLGLGFMAATHIQALAHVPGASVGAICNPSGRNLDGDLTRVGGNVGDPNGVRLDMTQVRAYRDVSEFPTTEQRELGWIDYCLKARTKTEYSNCIDWSNSTCFELR